MEKIRVREQEGRKNENQVLIINKMVRKERTKGKKICHRKEEEVLKGTEKEGKEKSREI